jgi:1-phosphofructokinase family hexose kinase
MIYTVTLNPGIDLQYIVEDFEYNAVIRSIDTRRDLGGKGFNVSNALTKLNVATTALGFVGGKSGEFLVDQLDQVKISHDLIWISGESRINTTILAQDKDKHLKVNEPGPKVQFSEQAQLLVKATNLAKKGDYFIFSGSLPPGTKNNFYAQLTQAVQDKGAKAVLDTSGQALTGGLIAEPFLIKPNRFELQQLTGTTLISIEDYRAGLISAHNMGASIICLSLGCEGAILSNGDYMLHAFPPKIKERNPVASGDALLAGIVAGFSDGLTGYKTLRFGVACGTAAASLYGTDFGSREMVKRISEQVSITKL